MSPNLKFHTPANPQTCTEQTHESNGMFLDEPWGLGHCFQSSCLLPLSFVIHSKVSLWLTVDRFRWHLSIPQRRSCQKVYLATIDPSSLPRNWRFTFPFCSCNQERHSFCATWKCQTRARIGKKEAYQLPLKSEQRNNFRSKERTTFISLHALCTQCFARFSVSPTFLRANFWWIAPIPIVISDISLQPICTGYGDILNAFF